MIGFYLRHLRLLRLSGITLPFVVHTRLQCSINSGAKLSLKSRVRFGNKKLLSLSAAKANLQVGHGAIVDFGHGVSVGPGVNLIAKPGARLIIGNNTYFTSDSHIEATHTLSIGSDCAISWGVTIIDSDHHEITYADAKPKSNATTIGDKVWIGCNVTVLKGTIIGNGCVIAAGSVVSGTFPDHTLIGGNPARVLRENIRWQ